MTKKQQAIELKRQHPTATYKWIAAKLNSSEDYICTCLTGRQQLSIRIRNIIFRKLQRKAKERDMTLNSLIAEYIDKGLVKDA